MFRLITALGLLGFLAISAWAAPFPDLRGTFRGRALVEYGDSGSISLPGEVSAHTHEGHTRVIITLFHSPSQHLIVSWDHRHHADNARFAGPLPLLRPGQQHGLPGTVRAHHLDHGDGTELQFSGFEFPGTDPNDARYFGITPAILTLGIHHLEIVERGDHLQVHARLTAFTRAGQREDQKLTLRVERVP